MGNNNFKQEDFRGYKQSTVPKIDEGLARTNPKTPCGEYLRRYWHPVALTSEVSKTPKEIRILGEDLVIFKTAKGNIPLVVVPTSYGSVTIDQLVSHNIKMVIYANQTLRIAHKSMSQLLKKLITTSSTQSSYSQ